MLGKLVRFIRSGDTSLTRQHPLLARVVATIGTDIGEARDFAKRLMPAIESAVDYFDRQIARIPEPLPLSAKLYATGAGVSSFFPEVEEVGRTLGRSLAVKETLPELIQNGHDEIYALLGMRSRPLEGAAEKTSAFADHTLHSLGTSLANSRETLRQAAFDRLLRNFAEHAEKLRRKERLLKLEWEWNQLHDAARTAQAADQAEFVYAAQELAPDNLLTALIRWFGRPESFFRLEKSGIAMPGAKPLGASSRKPLELPLLHCSDRRQWLVCFVRLSAAEGAQALQREPHTHRYIFI